MTQTKFVRMKLTTYRRCRKYFKGLRGESAAHYFERLSKWLEFRKKCKEIIHRK